MTKPVLGLILGAVLGAFDGLTALISAPETALVVGGLVAAFFAFLIAAMPNPDGGHYWVEIMLPGTIVGLIVGYATQKFGKA